MLRPQHHTLALLAFFLAADALIPVSAKQVEPASNKTLASPSQRAQPRCAANQILPDSVCTPGAVLTTDKATICKSGYTRSVRDVPAAVKKEVFERYGLAWSLHADYEVDHLISLELGGSNDIANLWPESYRIQNGSSLKDKFENYLHKEVCDGRIPVREAQREIATNWFAYYTASKVNPATPAAGKSRASQSGSSAVKAVEPAVKKSKTGLCHEKGATYYARTTDFTPYNNMRECLAGGGKLPGK